MKKLKYSKYLVYLNREVFSCDNYVQAMFKYYLMFFLQSEGKAFAQVFVQL
jgi:hypothetical protein